MKRIVLMVIIASILSLLSLGVFGYIGYVQGENIGEAIVYDATFDIAYQDAYDKNYFLGFDTGYDEGYSKGIREGTTIAREETTELILNSARQNGIQVGYADGYQVGLKEGISNGQKTGQDQLIENLLDFNADRIRQIMVRNGARCTTNICESLTYTSPDGTKSEWDKYDFETRSFYAYIEYINSLGNLSKQKVEIDLINGVITAEWRPIDEDFSSPYLVFDKTVNSLTRNVTSKSDAEQIDFLNDWIDDLEEYLVELKLDWLIYSKRN